MKAFVIDLSICNGCYCCQIACKDEHVANDWTPYAKPQPDTGQFWVGIKETVKGTVPKVMVSYQPRMCMHCEDAPCMEECKVEGAIYKRDDGLVIIDPEKCTGCKLCADACPYGVIYFNENLNIAQKCTGCAHLLDNGWKEPRCVDVCPTVALKFGEESELKDLIEKADSFRPELGLKTRVHYLNLPRKFVAGTLYDPVEKEVSEMNPMERTRIEVSVRINRSRLLSRLLLAMAYKAPRDVSSGILSSILACPAISGTR